ncbi:MAG TPA: protein-methionine-sulfoxide reductase heme-binding subunit MsrQ [Gemmatimonadales bacterium]|nr:protein-methionine-sulfoxide reductase heme-binding subunit MsrQ [Gemmatimonadales bacterium]
MTEARLIRRVLKPALWAAGLAPLGWLVFTSLTGRLEAEPVKGLEHFTGRTALIILLVTLSITPLRRLTGWNGLVKVRRLIGLFSFSYALLHFLIYLTFDLEYSFGDLAADITKRPWITVGFGVLLILSTLAVTSPQAMVRRLGGKRWQALHRLIYVAAGGAIVHFTWAQKKDISEPVRYAVVLILLLGFRLLPPRPRRAGRRRPAVLESPS